MPIVTMNPVFVAQLQALKTTNANIFRGGTLSGQRQWNQPIRNGWSGNQFDIFGMIRPFDRSNTNKQYTLAINNAGRLGQGSYQGKVSDVIAANAQVDYLASQERAYRARHMSPIRCKMFAAARRRGHAVNRSVFDVMVDHVANIINSGITQ